MKVRITIDRLGSMILKHGRYLEWFIQSSDDQDSLTLSKRALNLLNRGYEVTTNISNDYFDCFEDTRENNPDYKKVCLGQGKVKCVRQKNNDS
jgi:hypothetical protein